jgi:hypothetical protein
VKNGALKSLKRITNKYYSNAQYEESYQELLEEGLIS